MFLYRHFQEWRKNPHWSFSCCFGLLLPINDLQGEIHCLVDAVSVHKPQLQTGEMQFGEAVNFARERDKKDVEKAIKKQDEDRPDSEYSDTRCHQGTQTELFLSFKRSLSGTRANDRTTRDIFVSSLCKQGFSIVIGFLKTFAIMRGVLVRKCT